MQKCKNAEIRKCKIEIEKWKVEIEKWKFENRENAVFKTRHSRNQKQMVIILKTFTYLIHIISAY